MCCGEMYCGYHQVKKTLSQDIVLTTISPQRSVMATAVHSLEEVCEGSKCNELLVQSYITLVFTVMSL